MTDTRSAPRHRENRSSGRSIIVAFLFLITVMILLALGSWYFVQWANARNVFDRAVPPVDTVRHFTTTATPLFWMGIAGIALVWIGLFRAFRWRPLAIPIVVTVAALLISGAMYWQGQRASQSVTIETLGCPASLDPAGAGRDRLDELCTPMDALPDAMRWTDDHGGDAVGDPGNAHGSARTVHDLPVGTYQVDASTTAPPETAMAYIGHRDSDGIVLDRRLQPDVGGALPGRAWQGTITIDRDQRDMVQVFFLSSGPAAPDASISVTVHECSGTSFTSFDPASCTEIRAPALPLMFADTGSATQSWRVPVAAVEDGQMRISNLEARTYQVSPSDGIGGPDAQYLLIPGDAEQTASNNVLSLNASSGREEGEIEVAASSHELRYELYIIQPSAPVLAERQPSSFTPPRTVPT